MLEYLFDFYPPAPIWGVKSGDRSDKIRTYNFPQNRVTDHRIGLTLYNLAKIMEGDISELIENLKIADRAEKLQSSSEVY